MVVFKRKRRRDIDGVAWTGFVSEAADGGGYVLLFREFNDKDSYVLDLEPIFGKRKLKVDACVGGRLFINCGVCICMNSIRRHHCKKDEKEFSRKCGNECVVLALHKFRSDVWNAQYAGLCRYCRPRKWVVYDCCFPGTPDFDRVRKLLRVKNVVGIVTSLPVALPEDIRSMQPVVCFDCEESGFMEGCPYIAHDADYTAHLAARELTALPLRNFAYAHAPCSLYWNLARCEAFEREIVTRGGVVVPAFSMFGVYDRRKLIPALARWVSGLPKPCGIFAANDEMAMCVISVCREKGIRVPCDVAVVGVDDNRSICTSTNPTLSSIAPDWEAGAFMAASTLSRMFKAKAVGRRETFRPLGVIGRGTTARLSTVVNTQVVKAVGMIRSQACEGLKARDVVRMMGSSRRLAELRFREVTGKSILEEIRRVRHENACLMLSNTDAPLAVVAHRSGWRSLTSFCREFKETTGLTPIDWRQKSMEP